MSPIVFDNSYARLPEHFYAHVHPAKVPAAELIRLNGALAEELGVDAVWLGSSDGVALLSGNELLQGTEPIAQAYGGHQFGGWVPQLGDGRAILLGEIIAPDGARYDLQLKGSGRTPYSRGGDGKAAIGPVLREYILSEAMAALGVPTTRALAAVSTGELVQRETALPGAIFTRVARSHIRVGTFQYFCARNDVAALRQLADHAVARHFPEASAADNPYLAFLESVIAAQATLIAQWMHLGFIHGVMNTDNMTVSGETIDYGPCAFMDAFHSEKVFSSIDRYGRYAWSNQPVAGHWNLMRLAEALSPLLADDTEEAKSLAETPVATFPELFNEHFTQGFHAKLGTDPSAVDEAFLTDTLAMLAEEKVDFTLFFRHLTKVAAGGTSENLARLFDHEEVFDAWLVRWREQSRGTEDAAAARVRGMQSANPIRIPRNHRVEECIQQAHDGDYTAFHRLVDALQEPYADLPEFADLERAPKPGEVVCRTFCGT